MSKMNHNQMTLDQQIGQLFFIGVSGLSLTTDEKKFIVENNISGITLFGRNLQETFCIVDVKSYLLVMIGGYDSKIHVYTTKRDSSSEITFRFSMLGHLNSIKDLSVSPAIG